MKKTGFGLEHGDVPAGLFVEDAKVDVGHGGIAALWRDYRDARWAITEAIGRFSNIEAEVSELVVEQLHGGYRLKESSKSTDVVTPEGLRIQVKSRVLRQGDVTKLGTIRSWDFDILVIVLFSEDGEVSFAGEISSEAAREHAHWEERVSGYSISTTKALRFDSRMRDRSGEYQRIVDSL